MADEIIAERAIAMKQRQFSIKDMLAQPREAAAEPIAEPPPPHGVTSRPELAAEGLPPPDELSPLPGPGTPYLAASRASNKPVATLFLVLADASKRGFSYANLDTVDMAAGADPGQGPEIVLRYYGIAQEVRIAGRHLDRLYAHLGDHRLRWLRECAPSRDFLPQDQPVVTGITITTKIEG